MAAFNTTVNDGQLALESKNPVSTLNEILMKKGMSPNYELIYSCVDIRHPEWEFSVSAEGITAQGKGRSKQAAKQDAAANLLKILLAKEEEVNNEPDKEVDIVSPDTEALKALESKDPVSTLHKILRKKGMSLRYELIYDGVKDRHPRFEYSMSAEGITAQGKGRSKQAAKHDAAANLLKILMAKEEEVKNKLDKEVDNVSPDTEASKELESKNPVSTLHDILEKKGTSPQYELIYNGADDRHPRFEFSVSAEGFTAKGKGKSKQGAKHDAATNLLKILLAKEEEVKNKLDKEVDNVSPDTEASKESKNPVSTLHEHLQKKGMSLRYELIYNGIVDQQPWFEFSMSAEGITAQGKGRSKQAAKQDAATNLLKILLAKEEEVKNELDKEVDIVTPDTEASKGLGSKTPVSTLQEILQKKGTSPQYELIYNGADDLHPRFEFSVSAEGFTAKGKGRLKQEAKHDAAANLLKILLANKDNRNTAIEIPGFKI